MIHSLRRLFIVSFLMTIMISCNQEPQEILASSVTLDKTSIEVHVGQSFALSATVLPDITTDKTIVWSSSDKSVALVDDGLVSAIGIGRTIISASCGVCCGTCEVNVTPVHAEKVTLDMQEISLQVGETVNLTATVTPDDATDKTVTWTTSDASVATVSSGVVTARNEGTAIITVTTYDGNKTAQCTVTVNGINSIGEGGDIVTPNSRR